MRGVFAIVAPSARLRFGDPAARPMQVEKAAG